MSNKAGPMPKNDHNKTVGPCTFHGIRTENILNVRKEGVSKCTER